MVTMMVIIRVRNFRYLTVNAYMVNFLMSMLFFVISWAKRPFLSFVHENSLFSVESFFTCCLLFINVERGTKKRKLPQKLL